MDSVSDIRDGLESADTGLLIDHDESYNNNLMNQVTTTARFQCPNCKMQASVIVSVPEVDWVTEPLADSLSEKDVDIECPYCESSYSAHVQNSPSHCSIQLDEFPNVHVDADDAPFSADGPYEDDWLDDEPPESPYDVFRSTLYHLDDVMAEYGVGGRGVLPASAPLINRMVFATGSCQQTCRVSSSSFL